MLRLITVLPALARLVAAQEVTTIDDVSYDVVPTPDALPLDDLRNVEVPTYTSIAGLTAEIISYATATAVAAASEEQSETPFTVFPAVTAVPINAAGEESDNDDSDGPTPTETAVKRDIDRRSACDPQATISNYYKVNVDSYSSFKADATIASVALAAPTPSGYFANFKNAAGANSAYSYLGYAIVNSGKTGYDTAWCAAKCNAISGCLSFNIYFERDPTLEPGTGCTDPAAFANIKCSFWGSALDKSTATNYGQYRSKFQVGVAGSNAYTSFKLGGPIDGWSAPLSLNTSAMNAPLRDCADTWTYMGYKLFQSGPFNPLLCSAACDSQTAYNLANPPSTGKAPKCAAFGTYILTMTNKTGSYQQGQMCTLYTSAWDKQYAVNNVAYDDSIGAKYTYSYSFFYSKPDIQPICKSDISYLISSGSDFCTSFNSYSAPSTTTMATVTPDPITVPATTTWATTTLFAADSPTTTVTADFQWRRKRDSSESSADADSDAAPTYTTVESVPAYSAVILATYAETVTFENGTTPTDGPSNVIAERAIVARSAIATPASIASWPSSRISEACSAVATGTSTITSTVTATASVTTALSSVIASTTLHACVIPSESPDYTTFTPVWGSWQGDQLTNNQQAHYYEEAYIQIPFQMTVGSYSSNVITVGTNGYIKVGSNVQVNAFRGQGGGLYVYGGLNGVFYRIAGPVGSRQIVFSWFIGTVQFGHMQNHFTITYFENQPGKMQFKYYDVVQSALAQADASIIYAGKQVDIQRSLFSNGQQITVTTGSDNSVSSVSSQHDRVECCRKNSDAWWGGWHSCTEFQAPRF
nr:hypothetical protein CFP56_42213 [Quercus suber]